MLSIDVDNSSAELVWFELSLTEAFTLVEAVSGTWVKVAGF